MSTDSRYEIQAGIFLLVTLAMFAGSIFVLGRDRQVFESQLEYSTTFKDIKGLNEGAPVRLGGITVGRVSHIRFADSLTDSTVHVALLLNESFVDRLREDASASIETQGLLGDRFVSLGSGTALKPLPPGGPIPSREGSDLAQALTRAGSVVDNTAQAAERVNRILERIEGQPAEDLEKVLESTARVLDEIQHGNGFLNRIVFSKKDGDKLVGSLDTAGKDLGEIIAEIKNGQGLLNALIYGKNGEATVSSVSEAAQNLGKASIEIAAVAERIRTGNGLLNQMVYAEGPEGVDDIVASLARAAANLESVSKSLAEGSGTLGALLIDSKLYDNIVEITDDAKRSYILRRAIRKSLEGSSKSSTKDQDQDAAEGAPPTP